MSDEPTPTTPAPELSTGPDVLSSPEKIAESHDPVLALLDRFGPLTPMEQQGAEKMIRHEIRCVSLTVAELKMAIDRNPDHPVAQVYMGAIRNLKDTESVAVEQPDLQALIQNGQVKTHTRERAGIMVRTKTCE